MNQLRSTTSDDASNGIVVSFDAKWGQILRQKSVTRVFRKRAPRNMTPTQMYVYVGAPVSALIGRYDIAAIDWLPIEDILALASEGAISPDELRRYAGAYDVLAAYTVRPIHECHSPLPLSLLKQRFSFWPPQSFFVLSRTGQHNLDEVAGFIRRTQKGKSQ